MKQRLTRFLCFVVADCLCDPVDRDLTVKDLITARADKAAKVRGTLVTMAEPTVEANRILLLGKNGKTLSLYLTASSNISAQITLKTRSAQGAEYDEYNAGYYEVGFEAEAPVGQTDTFTTILSPNK